MSTSIQFRNIVTVAGETIPERSIRMRDAENMSDYREFVWGNLQFAVEALEGEIGEVRSLEYQVHVDEWENWIKLADGEQARAVVTDIEWDADVKKVTHLPASLEIDGLKDIDLFDRYEVMETIGDRLSLAHGYHASDFNYRIVAGEVL